MRKKLLQRECHMTDHKKSETQTENSLVNFGQALGQCGLGGDYEN